MTTVCSQDKLLSGVSNQARKFILANTVTYCDMLDLTPSGVSTLRTENSDYAKLGCTKVVIETNANITEDNINNVKVQWISTNTVSQQNQSKVILYLFGGGFVCGGPNDDLAITARVSMYTGCQICVPFYRLAPEHPYPAALNDIFNVYQSLIESYQDVVVMGESAGGNLALALVHSVITSKLLRLPCALVLLSPWIDLTHSGISHLTLEGLDPTLDVKKFLEPAAKSYANGLPLDSPAISPLWSPISKGWPPTFLSSGTRDLLLSDTIRLTTKLRDAGTIVDLHIADGLWHVYEWYPDLPESITYLKRCSDFISRQGGT